MSKRKYTVKLSKAEKEVIVGDLEIIDRKDLIKNFDEIGHVYFYKRVWEFYDLIYELGYSDDGLYSSLMEGFEITYDNARRWVKYDKELLYYYNLGARANLKTLYKLKDSLLNGDGDSRRGGTDVKVQFICGHDRDGKPLYGTTNINLKVLEEMISKYENKRDLGSGKGEMLNTMINEVIEGDLNG